MSSIPPILGNKMQSRSYSGDKLILIESSSCVRDSLSTGFSRGLTISLIAVLVVKDLINEER